MLSELQVERVILLSLSVIHFKHSANPPKGSQTTKQAPLNHSGIFIFHNSITTDIINKYKI